MTPIRTARSTLAKLSRWIRQCAREGGFFAGVLHTAVIFMTELALGLSWLNLLSLDQEPNVQQRRLTQWLQQPVKQRSVNAEWITMTVFAKTEHIEQRRVTPQENWLQWTLGKLYPPAAQTQNSLRIALGGEGSCSDRSQLLKSILERSRYRCRFIGLNGHVVLEVESNNEWHIADPDYGLYFPVTFEKFISPEYEPTLRKQLLSVGYSSVVTENYLRIVRSRHDNIQLPVGQPLSPRLSALEKSCDWLKWVLPVLGLASACLFGSFLGKDISRI